MSPGFSDSIKLPCSPHAFFLVIICLRSFCSYDSPRPSSSMKLSPSCRTSAPSRPIVPLSSLVATTSFLRFLFIHIVGVTRAIQRNLVFSRRLFPMLAGSQLSTPRLSNSTKTLSCFPPSSSSTPFPTSPSGHNSAEHLPPGFHSSPFFRFAPVALHRKQFVPRTNPHQLPSRIFASSFTQASPRADGDSSMSKGNNF